MRGVFIDLISILILSFITIIFVAICLFIARIKLGYTGQWFYLLIGVEVGLLAFFITEGLNLL